jgi:hypothetical protein
MKTRLWLIVLTAALLLSGGAAWADDFYMIAGSRAVGTRITSLPYTITQPGFYSLTGNLTFSGIGNAVTVSKNDVTLDLMGFSLTNGGLKGNTVGIYMYGRTNVTIRNGTVCGFYRGIFEEASSGKGHRVINVRAIDNTYGIFFNGSNHLLKSCSSDSGWTALRLSSGIIADCWASTSNHIGIALEGPGSLLRNTAINSGYNFFIGKYYTDTPIIVDRNSAVGTDPQNNYFIANGSTGVVITDNNAGYPAP